MCFKATLLCLRHSPGPITVTCLDPRQLQHVSSRFVKENPTAISAQLHLIQEDLSAAFYLLRYHDAFRIQGGGDGPARKAQVLGAISDGILERTPCSQRVLHSGPRKALLWSEKVYLLDSSMGDGMSSKEAPSAPKEVALSALFSKVFKQQKDSARTNNHRHLQTVLKNPVTWHKTLPTCRLQPAQRLHSCHEVLCREIVILRQVK